MTIDARPMAMPTVKRPTRSTSFDCASAIMKPPTVKTPLARTITHFRPKAFVSAPALREKIQAARIVAETINSCQRLLS